METQNSEALESLELEAEKRREEAAKKAKTPLPKSIKAIRKTEVRVVISPDVLPYKQVSPKLLMNLLHEKYGLSLSRTSDDISTWEKLGINAAQMTEEGLLALQLRLIGNTSVHFESGRYPTGPSTFVPISFVVFGSESITVNVAGITEVAEAVIADAFEILWQSSGALKKWDGDDVQNSVQLKSFGTITKIDLGCDPRKLLNPSLFDFFEQNINVGRKYGSAMMSFSGYDNYQPSKLAMSIWTFDDLVINVHIFNQLTGRQETAKVRFSVTTRDDLGRGILDFITELPFNLHAELVENLVVALRDKN